MVMSGMKCDACRVDWKRYVLQPTVSMSPTFYRRRSTAEAMAAHASSYLSISQITTHLVRDIKFVLVKFVCADVREVDHIIFGLVEGASPFSSSERLHFQTSSANEKGHGHRTTRRKTRTTKHLEASAAVMSGDIDMAEAGTAAVHVGEQEAAGAFTQALSRAAYDCLPDEVAAGG